MTMKKLILAAALAAACAPALAQYPNKPIRMIVPFPPGGAAELGARVFAQPLGQQLGQPIIIETRPGAEGIIASEAVRQSAPDGYTLYYGTATGMSYAPAAKKVPPYDPVKDFTPISLVGIFGFFVFSHATMPVKTIQDLVGYARANPGRLFYGTGNATSILATAQFAAQNGLDVVHVPYKGDGPLSLDPLLPEAPTMSEAGLQPVSITPWGGLFGPANLPKDIQERVNREIVVVLAKPEVVSALGKIAFQAKSSTPEQLTAFVAEQLEAYRRVTKQVGLSLN
jgi:tripartite-type tricarboxylate transporter receptor subunit TctC